jgi:chorismate dehydratase
LLFLPIAEKVRISIVSYTNTIPFRWGLAASGLSEEIDLYEDIPSECARKLLAGEADLALLPVAVLPLLDKFHIVSQFCIGADGVVDSVKLYSEVLVNEVKEVLLDYQSRTSVALARILFRKHWKHGVTFTDAAPGFEDSVTGTTAAVVIGDRTFSLNGRYKFEFDLAEEWKKFTGLPFVFAAWTSKRPLDAQFVRKFNEALAFGVANTERAVSELPIPSSITRKQATDYLKHRIDYNFDDRKQKALDRFLQFVSASDFQNI